MGVNHGSAVSLRIKWEVKIRAKSLVLKRYTRFLLVMHFKKAFVLLASPETVNRQAKKRWRLVWCSFTMGTMFLRKFAASLFSKFAASFDLRTLSAALMFAVLLGLPVVLGAQETLTGDRYKELLGLKPLGPNASATEREMVRVNHEYLNDMLANRKKHDAAAAELQPVLAKLYTAESFSDKQQIQDVITALKKSLEIDGAMIEMLEHSPEEMKKRLDASTLSAKDKNDVMEGFQRAYAGAELLDLYREARSRQELWISTSIDLYSFVMQNAEKISVREGQVKIVGHELVEQFNLKLDNSLALQQQVRETNARIRSVKAEKMKKRGITNSDVGLPEKPKQ